MKKTKVAQAVVGVAAAMTMTVMVGNIMPVNLLDDSGGYSTATAAQECCGPYAQPCPQWVRPAE
ncbi:MAG: hypothetical protein GX751_02150 [Desulfuromonadaceae bacterium]|jgi:hypothetical protein|nr:hypothetical protein [Desulfuromonadaceae bacterium]